MAPSETKSHLGLTDAGRTLLRGTGFVLAAAMVVPAFGVLAALVAVMVSALVIGFALRPRIQITGELPDSIVAGQIARLSYTLRNTARMPAYHLSVQFGALPDEIEHIAEGHMVPSLAPGETTEITVTIRPKRRGRYSIGQPICQSGFPFNLFSFGVSHNSAQTLTVLPPFYRLPIRFGRRYRHVHSDGAGLAGQTEASPEYAGNRPFLQGDSPRTIDVRAWARLGVPATKEYLNDMDSYAALILDTRVPNRRKASHAKAVKQLDAAASLCASLAFTVDRDCHTDLLLAGPDLHQFGSWPVATRLDRIYDILACVEATQDYDLEPMWATLDERFSEISQMIFVLFALDATYLPLLEMAGRAGCRSTVFVVSDDTATGGDSFDGRWIDDIVTLSPEKVLAGPIERL